MKIAVLSDIHGNLPALQAAILHLDTWKPDQVIVNGDIVNRGPRSIDCLNLIQTKQENEGWHVLRGNHEDFILECAKPDIPLEGPAFELMRFAYWAYQQLNGELSYLADLPDKYHLTAPDGSEIRIRHASMRNNRDGLYHNADDKELRLQIAPPPTVFVTGHTHRPFLRRVDDTLIVNTGSIGAPFDKDTRPSYGRFTWQAGCGWQADIARFGYDHTLAERDFVETGFLEEAGPLAQLMLVELRKGRGLIYRWGAEYEKAVLSGKMSIEDTVRELLMADDNRPYLGSPGWEID